MTQPMRPSPTTPTVPNPLQALRYRMGIKADAFAAMVGIKSYVLANIEGGTVTHVQDNYRAGFEAAGLDFDQIASEYTIWRDARLALPYSIRPIEPHEIGPAEASIVAAIEAGARGVGNIATRSGVSAQLVRQYLRNGWIPA